MNFEYYFKAFDNIIPAGIDPITNAYYYQYRDVFGVLFAEESVDNMEKKFSYMTNLIQNIYGYDSIYMRVPPGYEFGEEMCISEEILYFMINKSRNTISYPFLLWVSNNTLKTFSFNKKKVPVNPNILIGDKKISTVLFRNTFYFDFIDICSILKISRARDSLDYLNNKETEISRVCNNGNNLNKIYEESKYLFPFLIKTKLFDKYSSYLFKPYDAHVRMDELGRSLLEFPNIIEVPYNQHRYISLPMLYRFLGHNANELYPYLTKYLSLYIIPSIKNTFRRTL